jgi:hypothetical protein
MADLGPAMPTRVAADAQARLVVRRFKSNINARYSAYARNGIRNAGETG